MGTRRERIIRLLETRPGLTDKEIAIQLEGLSAKPQPFNDLCHQLQAKKILIRSKREDGHIGNYLIGTPQIEFSPADERNNDNRKEGYEDRQPPIEFSNELQKLISLGFEEVGRWFLSGGAATFKLNKYSRKKNLLYAFIVDGEVKYIGKTTQEFYRRLFQYKKCYMSQRTNLRIRNKIEDYLNNGTTIIIYAFVPETPMIYQDIPINLAAGLEDNLIKIIHPEWNITKIF